MTTTAAPHGTGRGRHAPSARLRGSIAAQRRSRASSGLTAIPALVSLATILTAACSGDSPPDADREAAWFTDVATEAGLEFRYESGQAGRFLLPEIVGGGACLFDHDGDGDLDVYFVQAGGIETPHESRPGNVLFENLGGMRFSDATASAGVADRGYGMGCATGDHDGDGDVDLLVTNLDGVVLYENDGAGRFEDVTAASGLAASGWPLSAVFHDIDGDADLDLYVTRYVEWSAAREVTCTSAGGLADYCKPTVYGAAPRDLLFRNVGGGRFVDASAASGIAAAGGHGMGVVSGDFDGNGRIDLYVANDATPNLLWLGQADGAFEEGGLLHGCALSGSGLAEAGMGLAVADLETDGDLDLLVSHLRNETNTLYVNRGDGVFDDATDAAGIGTPSLPSTGFGIGLHDFDHDGLLDLFVANGRVLALGERLDAEDPYAEPDLLMRGISAGRFVPLARPADVPARAGRGAAFGDLDNDGDLDAVVVNRDADAFLLRNDAGDRRGSLMLDVRDHAGAPAIGARVKVEAAGRTTWREVRSAGSYASSGDPRVHVGLGAATSVERVEVTWPDGATATLGPLEPGFVRIDPP